MGNRKSFHVIVRRWKNWGREGGGGGGRNLEQRADLRHVDETIPEIFFFSNNSITSVMLLLLLNFSFSQSHNFVLKNSSQWAVFIYILKQCVWWIRNFPTYASSSILSQKTPTMRPITSDTFQLRLLGEQSLLKNYAKEKSTHRAKLLNYSTTYPLKTAFTLEVRRISQLNVIGTLQFIDKEVPATCPWKYVFDCHIDKRTAYYCKSTYSGGTWRQTLLHAIQSISVYAFPWM